MQVLHLLPCMLCEENLLETLFGPSGSTTCVNEPRLWAIWGCGVYVGMCVPVIVILTLSHTHICKDVANPDYLFLSRVYSGKDPCKDHKLNAAGSQQGDSCCKAMI